MATYGYRCGGCGPFETRANPRAAGALAACPSCNQLSPRVYEAPGLRSARRARQLDGVGKAGRERVDRAQAGVPTVGAMPSGDHFHGGAPQSPRGAARRPWQVGH